MFFEFIFIWASVSSFDENLQRIIERNAEISAARENLRAVEASHFSEKFAYTPKISGSASQKWSRQDNSDPVHSSQLLETNASMNLFDFGAALAARNAGIADIRRAEASLRQRVLSVEAEGVSAMVNWLKRSEELAIYKEDVETRAFSLEVADKRFRQGLLPRQERESILVDLENSRARYKDAEIDLAAANAELNRLLGTQNDSQLNWPWKKRIAEINTLLSKTLDVSASPDWQIAALTVENLDAAHKKSSRELLPTLNGNAAYGVQYQSSTHHQFWSGGLSLDINLFNQMSDYSKASTYEYQASSARMSLRAIEEKLKRDWSARTSALRASIETALKRDENLERSDRLYEDNLERFRLGRVNANDLNVDQSRLQGSKLLATSGWANLHLTVMQVCQSLGQSIQSCISGK